MSDDAILARPCAVIAEVLELDDLVLAPGSQASDVEGWDSLATVEIMVALEKEFGLRFRTGEMADMNSIGELVSRIRRHRADAG